MTVLTARYIMAIVMVVGIMATVIITAVFSVVIRVRWTRLKKRGVLTYELSYTEQMEEALWQKWSDYDKSIFGGL